MKLIVDREQLLYTRNRYCVVVFDEKDQRGHGRVDIFLTHPVNESPRIVLPLKDELYMALASSISVKGKRKIRLCLGRGTRTAV